MKPAANAMAAPSFQDTDSSGATFAFVPFDEARTDWDGLLRRNPSARLYHHERWIEALRRAYQFEFFVAIARRGAEVDAGCLFARSQIPFSRRFVALPFSDSCVPLALDDDASRELVTRLAHDPAAAYEIRGALLPEPWRTVDCFINWELDLSGPCTRLYRGLSENFRRNVVKASRTGVKVECGHDVAHLNRFRVLHDASRHRQGLPSQPASFFRNLWALYGERDAEVWLASHNGQDLASVLVLLDGDVAYYKWSARLAGELRGAGHLLAWSLVETLATKQRILDLGRVDRRNHGLCRFKQGLGATSTALPYAFMPDAPREISAEVLSGRRRLVARLWQHLPAAVCRAIGNRVYRYLS